MRARVGTVWVIAGYICLMIPSWTAAQTQNGGRITGTVRDAQGAIIVNAAIKVESIATREEQTTVTDRSGEYSFAFLPSDVYELSILALGFETARSTSLQVRTNQTTTVNVVLSVARSSFEVTVVDAPALLLTNDPQIATALESKAISNLPLSTRNFLQLVTLTPGVSVALTNNIAIGRNSPNFYVNGARSEQNSVEINGVDANDIYGHDLAAVAIPAPESIQEVVVHTSMYDASLKSAGGANVEVTTKSGTDQIHGSVYAYLRNEVLDANDANLKKASIERPKLRRYIYGATLSGPIRKQDATYFLSYQGTREINGATEQSIYKGLMIVPGLRDDRSESTLISTFHPILSDGTYAKSINPISLLLLNTKLPDGHYLIPTPQLADGRVTGTTLSTYHEEQFNTNFNLRFRPQDTLELKLFFANAPQFRALSGDAPAGIAFGGTKLPGFGLQLENANRLFSVSSVHTFSLMAANEARLGFNFLGNRASPQEALLDSSIGIQRPTAESFPGMPTIVFARDEGGASIGSDWLTLNESFTSSLSFSDVVTLHRGKHGIHFGGEFRHYWWNVHANVNTYGEIDFPTFNDFLLGNTDFSSIGVGLSQRHFRTTDYNFFLQDDWKLSDKFTVNMGLRYELNLPPYETAGLIGGFDPEKYTPPSQIGSDGLPVGPPASGIIMAGNSEYILANVARVGRRVVNSVSPKNLGPRVGLVWSPLDSKKLLLRSGYGVFNSEPSFFYLAWDWFSPPFYQNFVSFEHTFANPFPSVPAESSFPLVQADHVLASSPFDPNLRTPYFQQFNASLQYELTPKMTAQVAYVGTRGLRLFRQVAINQARIASANHPLTNEVTGEVISTNSNENAPLRAPMQGVDTALFNLNQSNGQSTFHSLQAVLNRRLSRGLDFQGSYTFSKSIDNSSFPGLDTGRIVGNQLVAAGQRGLSDFDRTHRFAGYFMWDVPAFGFRRSSSSRSLGSDWHLTAIVHLISGIPIDIVDSTGGSLYGLLGARPNWASNRANRKAALSDVPSNFSFNPSAFAVALVQKGQAIPSAHDSTALAAEAGTDIGNVGRNVLRGPGQTSIDFSIAKRFPITESKILEFNADVFNLANHANRASPINDISVIDFGKIVAFSSSPRILQLSLKFRF